MRFYRCRVQHAKKENKHGMEIDKPDVTPAEILLLKHVHGDDAIINVQFVREGKIDQRKERERLLNFFGQRVFVAVFPGSLPRMPTTLEEAGMNEDGSLTEPTTYDPENERETPDAPVVTADVPVPEAVRKRVQAAAGLA